MLGVLRKCLPTLGSLQHLLGVCVCVWGVRAAPRRCSVMGMAD